MTQQLEKELQEQEAEIILTFRKEFHQLCEKFQMEGIYLGLRPEIKNIN